MADLHERGDATAVGDVGLGERDAAGGDELPEFIQRVVAAVHETSPAGPPKPRLFDRVRAALRTRHYSRRTEEAYVAWIRRYILFHGKRHPGEMGRPR